MDSKEQKLKQILESLSPNEIKILPHLKENIEKIIKETGLDKTAVLRALEFLKNKKIIKLSQEVKKFIDLDVNGVLYKKKGLPERVLLNILSEKSPLALEEAKRLSSLNDNEFKAALGALKKKALLNLVNGKLILEAKKEELAKKSLEEQFIEALPLKLEELKDEQKYAFESLKSRKKIIALDEKKEISIEATDLGKEIISLKDINKNLIEKLTPEMIKSGIWKNKTFRRYDIKSPLPLISGGKRHFVNQATDYARKIWTEMGFQEMAGNLAQESFWVFDALFTAQDHPVRDLQDTFFIDKRKKLGNKKLVQDVKRTHEVGIGGSKGWQYSWKEEEAEKIVLRTHTTCLSAETLSKLRDCKEKKGKFFAVGKCFRNETIDPSHLFEFNQTEGIVVDKDAQFKHLLGYLKAFLEKMGFKKIRFRPHYFPYTEPSAEADVYDEKQKKWVEILGAGIFRPEVVIPLLGEYIPVLAWGMGFDRIVMQNYGIKDIRELYKNDLTQLREIKFLIK